MPPIGRLVGKIDFSSLFVDLSGAHPPSLAEAKKAGAATLNYGLFINTVLEFVIVAFAVFLLVHQVNRWRWPAEAAATPTPALYLAVIGPRTATVRERFPRWHKQPLPYGRGSLRL